MTNKKQVLIKPEFFKGVPKKKPYVKKSPAVRSEFREKKVLVDPEKFSNLIKVLNIGIPIEKACVSTGISSMVIKEAFEIFTQSQLSKDDSGLEKVRDDKKTGELYVLGEMVASAISKAEQALRTRLFEMAMGGARSKNTTVTYKYIRNNLIDDPQHPEFYLKVPVSEIENISVTRPSLAALKENLFLINPDAYGKESTDKTQININQNQGVLVAPVSECSIDKWEQSAIEYHKNTKL